MSTSFSGYRTVCGAAPGSPAALSAPSPAASCRPSWLRRLVSRLRSMAAAPVTAAIVAAGAVAPAQAQVPPPEIAARSWLLMDMTTHTVLYSQLPDERVEPASLTKLMKPRRLD